MNLRRLLLLGAGLLAPSLSAQTWIPVGPPGGDVRSLAADPRDPRVVYLGTADGILYRSDDSGRRWRRPAPGFPKRGVSLDDLWVDPRGRVLAGYWDLSGNGGGVARSLDGGLTFAILAGIEGQAVKALAFAPSNPDVLAAGTPAGVFRSDDGGDAWRRISPDGHAEIRNLDSVAFDPGDPDTLYVGTWHLPWKTDDGGRTWRSASAGMIADSDVMTMTVDRRTPSTVYATACSGMYRSPDGAARWTKIRGIPSSSRRTRAFAQDPERPERFLAGTTEGLWLSEDGTATWRLVTDRELVVNALAVLPGGAVLAGCDGAGVIRSEDGGRTWAASNDGFSSRFVSRVAFDPARRRIVAGILGDRRHGGVLVAPQAAGPWTDLAAGLDGREVLSLAVAETGVFAGTDDGIYVASGASWRRLKALAGGIDLHPRVSDLVALPGQIILAATSKGLLRSTDDGATWQRQLLGLATEVRALGVSPQTPGLVLAATALGIFRSGDSGGSWTRISRGPDDPFVRAIALLPGDDRVAFILTPTGLFRSADGGGGWTRRGGGLPFSDITGLALDPDGRTAYAADFAGNGLFRSQDAGLSWEPFSTEGLHSSRVWAVALDPASPGRLLAATPAGGLHLLQSSTPHPVPPQVGGGPKAQR
jgi:photosystem II stability/assembly factor-like uncharacterized protein